MSSSINTTSTSTFTTQEQVPKLPSQQEGSEPVSGKTGAGTAGEPFDQGNQEEEDVVTRKNEGRDNKEPVSEETGVGAFDKGNEGNV